MDRKIGKKDWHNCPGRQVERKYFGKKRESASIRERNPDDGLGKKILV